MGDESPLSRRDMFEYWLIHMPFALDEFLDSFPDDIRQVLDYSVESLDVLEKWILDKYPSGEAMLDDRYVWDKIGRYIGTTFRKHIGGKWDIELDNPNKAFFRIPILVDHKGPHNVNICPFALATASANRRSLGFLRSALERLILE